MITVEYWTRDGEYHTVNAPVYGQALDEALARGGMKARTSYEIFYKMGDTWASMPRTEA